jgi:pyruvate/2-oxoglutarate dehydrogenase complex dihydrolipoamide acyltransferase (E2) component
VAAEASLAALIGHHPPVMTEQPVLAPFAGTVVSIAREPSERVAAGVPPVVLEAMKMEHEVVSDHAGVLRRIEVSVAQTVQEGELLAVMAVEDGAAPQRTDHAGAPDPDGPSEDLQRVRDRHALGLDAARPEAVAKRHEAGRRRTWTNFGT